MITVARLRSAGAALSLAALTIATLATTARPAAAQSDEQKRLTESVEVLQTLVRTPDDAIPEYILDRAEAIVVIPSLVKGGFIIGAQHGKGIMSVRDRATNTWSAPGFVALTGGSFGWQIGVQSVDLVLLVMNREGVKSLLDSEFKLGANASVAAGPVGRSSEASTDAKVTAEILAYSRAKGLFAGLTVEGSSLRNDKSANEKFYGKEVSTEEIVRGVAMVPKATSWADALKRLVPTNKTH